MNTPNIYIVGNIVFICFEDFLSEDKLSTKYIRASQTGIHSNDIWTEQEILAKFPNAKGFNSLRQAFS